jgi:hypothetical protein
MNAEQKKIVVYALYGLSLLLLLVFWRLGTQYDYSKSLLILKLGEREAPSYLLPNGSYGLRLRMGGAGVLCGLILPVVLAGAAAFISKSDKS